MYVQPHRVVKRAGSVMQSLPLSVEIEGRPGERRPCVVELPIERSHGVRHGSAGRVDADADAIGLHDHGHVDP